MEARKEKESTPAVTILGSKVEHLFKCLDDLKKKVGLVVDEIDKEFTNEFQNLMQAKEEFATIAQKIKLLPNSNQKVKLNIGGKLFATSLQTLTLVSHTLFTGMFSGYFDMNPDQDGEYFIDRNPKHFPLILDYLRNQHSVAVQKKISSLNCIELEELHEEVDYYGIMPLLEYIDTATAQSKTNSAKGKKWKLALSHPNHCFPNRVEFLNDPDKVSGAGTGTNSQDFIEAIFDEKVAVSKVTLAATTLGGVDETRINGAIFQASENGSDWKEVLTVSGVPKQGPTVFALPGPVTGYAFRFLHGLKITSDRCLALGALIFE